MIFYVRRPPLSYTGSNAQWECCLGPFRLGHRLPYLLTLASWLGTTALMLFHISNVYTRPQKCLPLGSVPWPHVRYHSLYVVQQGSLVVLWRQTSADRSLGLLDGTVLLDRSQSVICYLLYFINNDIQKWGMAYLYDLSNIHLMYLWLSNQKRTFSHYGKTTIPSLISKNAISLFLL